MKQKRKAVLTYFLHFRFLLRQKRLGFKEKSNEKFSYKTLNFIIVQ